MPGRGGLDVLKEIKSDFPKLPVLILSIHPEDQYAVRALDSRRFEAAALQNFQVETTRRMQSEINIYRRVAHLNPAMWQNYFFNGIIGSGLAKPLFERAAKKWVDTAFNKPIIVQF